MATSIATPYRDPRTAFGRRIPVGEATELAGMPPEFQAPRSAAPPAAAPGGIDEPPQRRGTVSRAGLRLLAGPVGVAAAAAPEALDVARVARNPNATGIDVATQAAEGTGRLAAAGAGAMVGAKAGTAAAPFLGPLAPIAPLAGAAIGGGIAYFGADKAIRTGREVAGVDPRSPVEQVPAPAAAAAPVRRDAGAGRGFVNPPSIADMPAPQAGPNTIIRDGNAYSGPPNITEGAEIRRPNMALRNGGQVSVVPGRGAEVQAIEDRARSIEAVNQGLRRDLQALEPGQGGLGQGASLGQSWKDDLRRRELEMATTSSKTGMESQRAYEMRIAGAVKNLADFNNMLGARETDANRLAIAGVGASTQRGIAELNAGTQREVASIGAQSRTTAAEMAANARAAAAESAAKRYTVVPGGQEVVDSPTGPVTIKRPDRVFENATGKFLDAPAAGGGNAAAPPTPRAEYAKMPKGARYVGPDGQTYIKA